MLGWGSPTHPPTHPSSTTHTKSHTKKKKGSASNSQNNIQHRRILPQIFDLPATNTTSKTTPHCAHHTLCSIGGTPSCPSVASYDDRMLFTWGRKRDAQKKTGTPIHMTALWLGSVQEDEKKTWHPSPALNQMTGRD